jgi:hypothetical protein
LPDHPATDRRRPLYLTGAWLFTAVAIVGFAWLTTGSYVRQTLRPLPGEAGTTVRDCQAVPSCAPDALDLVNEQLVVLRHTRTLVYASAWSVTILAAVTVAAATVLFLRHRSVAPAPVLRYGWKAQAAVAAVLLVAQGVMLAVGARTLNATPEAARLFTAIKTFDSPFIDVGDHEIPQV